MLPFARADEVLEPRALPPLDGRIPAVLETATFANGLLTSSPLTVTTPFSIDKSRFFCIGLVNV